MSSSSSSFKQEHVVVVGNSAYDSVFILPHLETLGDCKVTAQYSYRTLGGGGANVAIAIAEMQKYLPGSRQTSIALYTKIGKAADDYSLRDSVLKTFDSAGIVPHDLMDGKSFRIAENCVVAHSAGRLILREPVLSAPFNEKAAEMDDTIIERLKASMTGAKYVVLQSNDPELARIAAGFAKAAGAAVIMDYSVADPKIAEKFDAILPLCDYVFAPGEAKLAGMVHDGPPENNADILLAGLKALCPQAFVAISDGAKPVLVHQDNQHFTVEIGKVEAVVDALAAGDTRCAAFVYCLLQGDNPLLALKKASAIASFSIQHPGRDWLKKLPQHLDSHPLFQKNPPQHPGPMLKK